MKLAGLRLILFAAFCATQTPAQAPAAPAPKPFLSHQTNSDGTLTFRYRDGAAHTVILHTDASLDPLPMGRDDNGVWAVTTPEAVKPGIYGYLFVVDGTSVSDPRNGDMRRNLLAWSSEITVPATPPAPWELTAVPHGSVDHHFLTTHIAKNLPANQEAYVVYTPPHYDAKRRYPLLVLLHGFSDDETGWTGPGRANLILDSLLAQGSIGPMIVVMPEAYGDFSFVNGGMKVWRDDKAIDANTDIFGAMLMNEILPAVEHDYAVAPGRNNRAITGLSMGGLESLKIGLSHAAQFAYVGGFSAAAFQANLDSELTGVDQKSAQLKLLWVACGTSDPLIEQNRRFENWATGQGFPVTKIETPGAHTWVVWRDNLIHFTPLLFQGK